MDRKEETVLFTLPGSLSKSNRGNAWLMPTGNVVFTQTGMYFQNAMQMMRFNLFSRYIWKLQTQPLAYQRIQSAEIFASKHYQGNTLKLITDEIDGLYYFSVFLPQSDCIPPVQAFLNTARVPDADPTQLRQAAEALRPYTAKSKALHMRLTVLLLLLGILLFFLSGTPFFTLVFWFFAFLSISFTGRPHLKYVILVLLVLLLAMFTV